MTLVVDTDTASDDAVALLVAALADADLAAVTVVAGNTGFDQQVRNARYTLDLAGADAPVHPGARAPLVKPHEPAEDVHGEGGFAGFAPDPPGEPADEGGVDRLVRAARAGATIVCIGPLTNLALALRREPALGELAGDVVVMCGACNTLGNVTPAAEFNAWADPDAAALVFRECPVTMVDWGVSVRDGVLPAAALDDVAAAETPYAEFVTRISERARAFTRDYQDIDGLVQPDALAVAAALDPGLVETERRYVACDPREGMTRGYTLCDERGVLGAEPLTDVVTAADAGRFRELLRGTLLDGDPGL